MPERYEREIADIIKKTGADLDPRTSLRQAFADLQQRVLENIRNQTPKFLRAATARRMGTIGVVLLIAAYFVKTSHLAILSVTFLLAAYFIAFVRSPESESRWRGQAIDARSGSTRLSRLKQWLRKKPTS